jgi:hypothetical protein
MKTLILFLGIVLLATLLVAQDAPIPQELPLHLRNEPVRRSTEQPIPHYLPLQQLPKRLDNSGFLNRLGLNKRPTVASAVPVEDRIAALEARVEALQNELEAQKALIKHLQELLDQQQKKN